MDNLRTAVIGITSNGVNIAKKIQNSMNVDLFFPTAYKDQVNANFFDNIKTILDIIFKKYDCIIFIMAVGATIRLINPHIKNKFIDPRIVVIDDASKFTISLLSGHRGANDITLKISKILGNQPVITTASDLNNIISPEYIAYRYNMKIINKKLLTKISAEILKKGGAQIINKTSLKIKEENLNEDNFPKILITFTKEKHEGVLYMIPKILVVGIGFSTSATYDQMKKCISYVFNKYRLYIYAIQTIATIDIKRGNIDIKKLSRHYNAGLEFYSKEQLNEYSMDRSDEVYKYTGAYSVANAAARLASKNGKYIVKKEKFKDVVISVFEYEK